MTKKPNIYKLLEEEISKAELPDEEKNRRLSRLLNAKGQSINLMLVGPTGSGKSSTINSLFDMSVAKVGIGVDPETSEIDCYQLENLTIWDTPGLGDGIEADEEHSRQIIEKLSETDDSGNLLIDLVMVVVDGSSKDLSATYSLINEVLLPCLTPANSHRILIAINQADMAMKGNHWDNENNCPDEVLEKFLKEKCVSISERIKEASGIEFKPIFYCAGYTDDDGIQRSPYNLTKLLYHILLSLPAEKRLAVAENINDDDNMWEYDDDEADYREDISRSFSEVVFDNISEAAEKGFVSGGVVLGFPGAIVGGLLFGAAGAIKGVFKGLFG